MSDAPRDNLVRAFVDPTAAELRATTTDDGRTLFGHFAVFNRWTEIDSAWEGRFLERVAPGAFAQAFAERRDQIKVLYDHGHDPQLGNKPLGPIRELREDKTGAYYEVDLIHASYNDEFVIPAARAGLLGASFRFKVAEETWVDPPAASKHNPTRMPERTITRVDPLYEFGPVTFPAYPDGTQTGVRSLTDDYIDRLLHDPLFLARFAARAGSTAVERLFERLPSAAATEDHETPVDPPPAERSDEPEDDALPAAPYTPTTRPRRSIDTLRDQRAQVAARIASATR